MFKVLNSSLILKQGFKFLFGKNKYCTSISLFELVSKDIKLELLVLKFSKAKSLSFDIILIYPLLKTVFSVYTKFNLAKKVFCGSSMIDF